MTDELRRVGLGDVALREDAGGDGRTIHGYAYRWGDYTPDGAAVEYPGMEEGFARGAFADAIAARGGRPWPFLDEHRGRTVAGITFREDDIGLAYEGRLLDTEAAREYAATVPAGNDGVSLEFVKRGLQSVRQGSRRITHTKVPLIAALAGTYAGAYRGAGVALRNDGGNGMDPNETTTPAGPETAVAIAPTHVQAGPLPLQREDVYAIAQDVTTEALRGYVERGAPAGEPDPMLGYSSLGTLFRDAAMAERGDALLAYAARAIARRALDNSVFTSGANAGLASGNLVRDEIAGIVNRGRPAITAFGGPRPLGDTAGLTLEWPYFDGTLTDFVGAQSAEKAEVTSASMDIKLATEALVTYAGGSDLSYQLIRRGSPSALDAFARIILAAWAAVTDAAFVTELETGSATIDFAEAIASHDLAEFIANLIDGSVTVEAATGRPAEFALMSTTAFAQYAKLVAASSLTTVVGAQSGFTIDGLNLSIGGIRLIHVPSVTAGKVIISNSLAAAWYEDGPFQATSEDAPKLGRDVVYWSLGAGARLIPAGILEAYDVTP